MSPILVGTTSWTEKTLVESGCFYPPDVHSAEARLRYYATQFRVVEVDSSYYGRMQVPEETLATLQAEGIEVRLSKISEAVAEFNRLQRDCARIIAALHLTCRNEGKRGT